MDMKKNIRARSSLLPGPRRGQLLGRWLRNQQRSAGCPAARRGEEGEAGCAGARGWGPPPAVWAVCSSAGNTLSRCLRGGGGGGGASAGAKQPVPSRQRPRGRLPPSSPPCLPPPRFCGWKQNREAVRTSHLPIDSQPRALGSDFPCKGTGSLNPAATKIRG